MNEDWRKGEAWPALHMWIFSQSWQDCANPSDLSTLKWWLIKNMDYGARLPGCLDQPHYKLYDCEPFI